MCKPVGDITIDQVKLRLFIFFIDRSHKVLVVVYPKLHYLDLERARRQVSRYILFQCSVYENKIRNYQFCQEEAKSLSDAWERFKLLLQKCLNYNMSYVEKMIHFIDGLRTQTRMFLDASAGGTVRLKSDEELKTLIENMCQNEYRSSKRAMKQKGIH